MFPPLFHRVRIALKNRTGNCTSTIIAIYTLNLRSISHSGEYGKIFNSFVLYAFIKLILDKKEFQIYLKFRLV